MTDRPARRQRVAAYALIVEGEQILLTQLVRRISPEGRWTLPGGGVEFGEDPREAVVREIHEETGLVGEVPEQAWVTAKTYPTREGSTLHTVQLIFEGTLVGDRREPEVLEIGGSTADAAWHPLIDVVEDRVPVSSQVLVALQRTGRYPG